MSDQAINSKLISSDLLSGTLDRLRTAAGGYYDVVSASTGTSLEFMPFFENRPRSIYIDAIRSRTDITYIQPIDAGSLMPNKKFPIRIYGNPNNVKSDAEWKSLFVGGPIALYQTDTKEYFNVETSVPYSYPRDKYLNQAGLIVESVAAEYDFNRYMPRYYQYINSLDSEIDLPNFYLLNDMSTHDFDNLSGLYAPALVNSITRDGTYEDLEHLFTLNNKAMRVDIDVRNPKRLEMLTTSKTAYDYSYLSTTYMSKALIERDIELTTKTKANALQRNILFDIDCIDKLYTQDKIETNVEYFPYCAKISFPLPDTGEYYEAIKKHNFSSKFLRGLLHSFEIPGSPANAISARSGPASLEVASYEPAFSETGEVTANYAEKYQDIGLRYVDYLAFLSFCHNDSGTPGIPYMFMGGANVYRNAASAVLEGNSSLIPTSYRHINSMTSLGVIASTVATMSGSEDYAISSLEDIYTSRETYGETLAYKITKINASGAPVQNYFVMNSDMESFVLYDTQVKPGETYQYDISVYEIIQGFKYKYSNLLLTRTIGCNELGESGLVSSLGTDTGGGSASDIEAGDIPAGDASYGLEFYNASTGILEDQLYVQTPGTLQRLNDYATMSEAISPYPYLADMYVEIEPFVKLVRRPLRTVSVAVTDNWPPKPKLVPYHILDASQIIGFEVSVGDHVDAPYQQSFPSEMVATGQYLASNNLLMTDEVTKTSVSQQRYIEVYRLNTKPVNIGNFEGSLVRTLDLKIKNSAYCYKTTFYEDIINTNKKYYYIFRTRNEFGTPGHFSDIIEAELISDGGYVYSVFKALSAEDLAEEIVAQSTKPFKSLLQIRPTMAQTDMQMSNVDYTKEATSQLANVGIGSAEDLIWDKTFKIRLISKKTNKKIDLNITYKLDSEY